MTARIFTPREYQAPAIDHLLDMPRDALWMAMGGGKTVSVLTALTHLSLVEDPFPTLVIAPLRVATSTWPDEVRKWSHLHALRVVAITGSAEERRRAMRQRAEIYTINYENIPWLVEELAGTWPYRVVICDESTKLKSFRLRQGSKRAKALAKVAWQSERFVELTGTPSPNGLVDLWGQLWFLDRGERLGRSFDAFRQRWFNTIQVGADRHAVQLTPLPFAREQIEDRLRDICLSIDVADYLDIREPVINTIRVELPAKARRLYRDMEREMFLALECGTEVEAFNAASKTIKCLQLCLAKGTEVLSKRGWLPIENIGEGDLVWDGHEWATVGTQVCQGVRKVVNCWGVNMTPDHLVLTEDGWRTAEEIIYGYASERPNRAGVRIPDCVAPSRSDKKQACNMALPLRMRPRSGEDRVESARDWRPEEVVWLSPGGNVRGRATHSRYDPPPRLSHLERDAATLREPAEQGLEELWQQRDFSMRALARVVRQLPGRHVSYVLRWGFFGPHRQQRPLLPGQLSMGDDQATVSQPTRQRVDPNATWGDDSVTSRGVVFDKGCDASREAKAGLGFDTRGDNACQDEAETFDLVDVGRRNQFVVRPPGGGTPFIVHNCNGAIYTDDTATTFQEIHDAKLQALESIIEEAAGAPVLVAYHFKSDLARLQRAFAQGRPLDADPRTIADWNAGRIPVLFAHPASAGHGLNLQDGGNILVFFSHWWNLEEFQQIIERIGPTRQAQAGHDRPVFIHHIVAAGTVDELVMARRESKREVQDLLMEAMKRKGVLV